MGKHAMDESDQDRGCPVISGDGEVLDGIRTFDWGSVGHSGENFREWRRRQKEERGPAEKLLNNLGEQAWKMKRT